MKISDIKGNEIASMKDWEDRFFAAQKRKRFWKEGNGEFELANFLINGNADGLLAKVIGDVVKENIKFDVAYPEFEVKYDKFGQGRINDIGIYATTQSGKKVFVAINARCEEPYVEKVVDVYFPAKINELNGVKTNAAKRVEEMLKKCFKEINQNHLDLKYDLLTQISGTAAAQIADQSTDFAIMLDIVFKPKDPNKQQFLANYMDYILFLNSLDSDKIMTPTGIETYKINVADRDVYALMIQLNKK